MVYGDVGLGRNHSLCCISLAKVEHGLILLIPDSLDRAAPTAGVCCVPLEYILNFMGYFWCLLWRLIFRYHFFSFSTYISVGFGATDERIRSLSNLYIDFISYRRSESFPFESCKYLSTILVTLYGMIVHIGQTVRDADLEDFENGPPFGLALGKSSGMI